MKQKIYIFIHQADNLSAGILSVSVNGYDERSKSKAKQKRYPVQKRSTWPNNFLSEAFKLLVADILGYTS